MSDRTTAAWLRAQPSLTGNPPPLDLSTLPGDPSGLFTQWLGYAIDRGVAEPLAATVSSIDADGVPDARILILKDVGERGWAFAGNRSSTKGKQLQAHPVAAMNFWWQPLMRAVRIRGPVREASREECEADLASRSPQARASVAGGDWTLWWIEATRVEFWQGSTSRRHTRIVYERDGPGWSPPKMTGTTQDEETRNA